MSGFANLIRQTLPYPLRCNIAGALRRAARGLDGYPVEVIRIIHGEDGRETFAPSKHLPIRHR